MKLELRHLRVICAIAEAGSVTKAAAVLSLAAPALTAQLQRIERTLGGQLFERDRHGARPTALGEFVLARARVLLPAVNGLQDEAARLAGAGAQPAADGLGTYRLGAINGPVLGGVVHRLAAAYPQAHISTYASWSAEELAELVFAGRLDFVLAGACGEASVGRSTELAWRPIAVAPVFALLPERHPLAGRGEVELVDFASEHWAATPGDGCFADCFAAACAAAGFTPRTMYETDVGGCIDLVQAGDAVGLCQPTFRPAPGVVPVPLAGAPLRWRHLLGWHPHGPASAFADQLAGFAQAAYVDAVRRSPRYAEWLSRHPRFASGHLAAA